MMMGGLLRGTLLVALVAVPSVGEKLVWGVNDGDEWYTRSCQKLELTKCKETYELCIREVPAGDGYSEAVCDCADEYYGVCSRQAGCASSLMTQCIDEMYRWQCPDSSICGSNCVDQGNTHIPPGSHVLPVNNFGQNALRFSVCFQTFNTRSLNRYGMVVMEYCQPHDFHLCPYWVPPQTFTAIAIQHNASYLKMEFCVIAEGEKPRGSDESPAGQLSPPSQSPPCVCNDTPVHAPQPLYAAALPTPKLPGELVTRQSATPVPCASRCEAFKREWLQRSK